MEAITIDYSLSNLNNILDKLDNIKITKDNKKIEYYELPCSFDIETSSFYQSTYVEEPKKVAILYAWVLTIKNYCLLGRTWEEYIQCQSRLVEYFNLYTERRLIIYVHNLSYEFQFFRKIFDWDSIFSLEERKPIKALTLDGIEYRCSYILSGYSLAKLTDQLTKHTIKKLVGDLDYKKIRTPLTPLTNKEKGYIYNDGLIVSYYIEELIETYGSITKLPLTKTGFVRRYCRDNCLYVNNSHKKDTDKYHKYRKLMKALSLDVDTFNQLQRAFQGGFTHANALYSNEIMYNVGSFDETSAYPYQMCAKQFPMTPPFTINKLNDKRFNYAIKKYCCLFEAKFINIKAKVLYENYISKSKCYSLSTYVENNGRIVQAKELSITLTEQDYLIIKELYSWENIEIKNFKYFGKAYLPTDLVKSILKLYNDKTKLKGVVGKEIEYLNSKEQINSVYGMSVTNPCREEIIYNEEWSKSEPNIKELLESHNKSIKRFLYYAWGIWVTAYNRKDLFDCINEFKDDYIYSDTDSVKGINIEKHLDYINKHNKEVEENLKNAMEYHNLPFELTKPKTINGVEKPLGVWEYETTYSRFKTLGAKRYMVEENGNINITVSGVNKKFAVPYLIKKYKDKVFENFNNGLEIPAKYTGKNIHTYIDEERIGIVKDYLGKEYEYHELSGVHLEETSYNLSLTSAYVNYILGIQDKIL